MKTNHSHSGCRQVLALLLTVLTVMSMLPSAAFAAQPTTYRDPAEHWMNAGSRTNELDINAVVSHETFYCHSCKQYTSFTIWRTPEYTRDGQTALTRNVLYSDGTMVDGEGTGSILDGDPGIDAFYTGYHWTKSMCDNCGVMNANGGTSHYGYSKNVYNLYDCASGFSEDLKDDVTYEYADDTYHTKTVEGGHYCEFCFGTVHTHSSTLERHNLKTEVKAQLDKQRFAVVTSCADCDYTKTEYVAAKSVVADYYGAVDGQAHTLTVSDLSESGVTAKIRYGNSADACTLVTPPSYTEEGQYTVYYAVTYTYKNVSMTENGVAYVWLHDESVKEPEHPNPAHDPSISVDSTEHNYVYLDTVAPTCSTLGYDRYLCSICGAVDKRNYQNATGHAIQSILIREADCEHEGKTLEICRSCGEVKETLTPKGEHQVKTYKVSATCTAPGYTVRECDICGDRQITDITAVKGHSFVANVVAPTCTTGGHTQHICKDCGESYFDSYTQATGHDWDDGTVIKDPTCNNAGVIEYRCKVCDATKLEDYNGDGDDHDHGSVSVTPVVNTTVKSGTGHRYTSAVTAPTCTEMGFTTYTCVDCGDTYKADYVDATGHTYKAVVTKPTCTKMGYTTYTCKDCGNSYKSDYTELLGHDYTAVVTAPTCTEGGYTAYTCTRCGDSYVDDVTEALGHDWKAPVILADSTCNSDGVKEYDCSRCDAHYHEAISAKGHNPGPDATCLNPQTCKDCGAVLAPATGHQYTKKVTKPACTKMGYTTYTCDRCGDSYKSDYTELLGHDYVAKVTDPTCTEGGYTTFTCSRCGDSYVTDYTDPTGHDWDAGTKITDATCNGEGVLEHHCKSCDETYLEAVSAKGHNPGSKATCTEDQICRDCGAVIEKAHGHDFAATVTAPTCTELGFTTYACKNCDKTYISDYVKSTGHKESNWIVDRKPTTEAEGSRHKECVTCHEKLVTEPIAKLYLYATTDSRGEATVGEYLVIVTDTSSGKPITNAAVELNKDGTISVRFPDGRLLDYGNHTTVYVLKSEDKSPVKGVQIYVTDVKGNYVPDVTDKNGQITIFNTINFKKSILNTANGQRQLNNNVFQASSIAQRHNCALTRLDFQQEEGLFSCLPLGNNLVDIRRGLTTSSTAIFVPFTTQELFQTGAEALYYGINALSNNLIMVDRKLLKNPNGLILGTPGSGKSFSAKREISNAFLICPEDDIIICDPEGEYAPLAERLNGQVIKISPTGKGYDGKPCYINPMDLNLDYSDDENPLSLKSDFILSLCELIVGGKDGLAPVEKTIIDRCVRLVYRDYLSDPCPENMPVLEDLYNALRAQEEKEAQYVATALEIYVTGSLNVFNHRTNVDINSRIVCYDIKELGKQLKKIGMLIVQDQVWNRVTINRAEHKTTRYYIDEFHLLLKEEQTASYSVEIWKRFRKWGGIPTGITQNVKDLLSSREVENIFENSDFIYMLNQAAGDRQILAKQLNISPHQLSYVTHSGEGEGLLFYGNTIIPFVDHFPKDTELYRIMTTKPQEVAQ